MQLTHSLTTQVSGAYAKPTLEVVRGANQYVTEVINPTRKCVDDTPGGETSGSCAIFGCAGAATLL